MKRIKVLALLALFTTATAFAQEDVTVYDPNHQSQETIGLPEGMTINTDSLVQVWKSSHYLISDTGCVRNGVNPEFTPEEYIARLRRMPTIMEMPYNDVVRTFIDLYAVRLRQSVSFMLGASNFYVPIFEEALDRHGLPLELKYLPIIESALNPTAKSHAGAVGLWQFMIGTARRYQLDENSLIDDRMDPIKSSDAAARYLKDLYRIYGDWNLVIAAYNCGPSNIEKAIRRADGKRDYWAIYPFLPKETRGYVPAFIAANYIMTYYCDHNICPMSATLPPATDTIQVSRDVYMEQIADLCHIELNMVRSLNPQYKTNLIPGNSQLCTLRLPLSALNAFLDAKDAIYTYNLETLQTNRSVVEVDTRTYVSNNNTQSTKNGKSKQKSTTKSKKKEKASKKGATTTARKGDTLSEIAARNGTTVSKLKKLNKIKGNSIQAGQKIRVK